MHLIKLFSGNDFAHHAFDFILDCDALSNLMIINHMEDFNRMKEKL